MAKVNSKSKPKNDVAILVGNPDELVNLMISDKTQKIWAIQQLTDEGPKHKQVLTALMLKSLYKLVRTIEKKSGTSFELQHGYELIKEIDDVKSQLPISLPINLGTGIDKKKVAEAILQAPDHEALAYAMCIQVIEWAIKTTAKK